MSSEIRDPIHGPIRVSSAELKVIDAPAFQRLRRVQQLGFGALTFPGATHTRYLHSLGAMELAGVAFDSIARSLPPMDERERARFRAIVRLAALLHDIGHPPLSHQLEHLLPPVAELNLPGLDAACHSGQARHEHFSLLILLQSQLTDVVRHAFADWGVEPIDVAAVLMPGLEGVDPQRFTVKGRSILPLMQQLVAGELDCDRMDYLRRDAYFAGVSYGNYDHAWILSNMIAVERTSHYELGLHARAIHTFEDFLIARHHMFMMVYAHQRSQIFNRILRAFFEETQAIKNLPADPEAYIQYDDGSIWQALKDFPDQRWAKRLLLRIPIPLTLQLDEDRDVISADEVTARLDEADLSYFKLALHRPLSTFQPSKRSKADPGPPLQIVFGEHSLRHGPHPVAEATDLYERYARTPRIVRFYLFEESIPAYKDLNLAGLSELKRAQ